MIELRDRAGLVQEPFHALARALRIGGQKLERHQPVEPLVAGLVDHAHAALGDALEQLVVRDALADLQRRGAPGLCTGLPHGFFIIS